MLTMRTQTSVTGYFTVLLLSFCYAENATDMSDATAVTKVGPSVTLNPWVIYATSPPPDSSKSSLAPSSGGVTKATTAEVNNTTTPTKANATQANTTQANTTQANTTQANTTQANTTQANTTQASATSGKRASTEAPRTTDPPTTALTNTTTNTTRDDYNVSATTKAMMISMTTIVPASNCTINATHCKNGASCYEDGSRIWCRCTPGWTGEHCELDIDECNATSVSLNGCDSHADCRNTLGGYNCTCHLGYTGNGFSCMYEQQCSNGTCFEGECLAHLLSHECLCYGGWHGVNCSDDVDECLTNSDMCVSNNSFCLNTIGSHTCVCKPGYSGDPSVGCTENTLWPFGVFGTNLPKGKDSKVTLDVAGGFPYYGQMFYQIQISSNGYLSFGPDDLSPSVPSSNHSQLPGNVSVLAPYWSNIEVSQRNDSMVDVDVYDFWNATLNTTSSDVHSLLIQQTLGYSSLDFDPRFAVVVTWKNVVPYPARVYSGWENATFQVVIATDGSASVAFVNYAIEGMDWNPASDNRTIVIGITDGKNVKFNYTGDVYRPDKATNIGKAGRFFFLLGEPLRNTHLPCIRWYQTDSLLLPSVPLAVPPCPCTLEQAMEDWRYINSSQEGLCLQHRLSKRFAVNLCCYDNSFSVGHALIVGVGGGYLKVAGDELDGKKKCCDDVDLCHLFYARKPSDDCRKYLAPSIGAVWGDPYFSTLDGEFFSFNYKGEYSLLQFPNGQLWVQGRFQRSIRSQAAFANMTTLTAVAMKSINGSAMELQLKDGTLRFYANGRTYPLPWNGSMPDVEVDSQNNSSIFIHFDSDIIIKLSLELGSLRLKVLVPIPFQGWNDSTAGGLLLKKCRGSLPSTASESDTFRYLSTCSVLKNESLFMYDLDGSKYELANDQNFVPSSMNNSMNSSITPWCGNSRSCVMEYVKTGVQERAVTSKTFEDGLSVSRFKLDNFPPVFGSDLPLALFAVFGQQLNVSLNASDPEGGNVEFHINTLINATEWELANNSFFWKPLVRTYVESQTTAFLQIHAFDNSNASALYWPYVHLCPCLPENGYCPYNYPPKLDKSLPAGRLIIGRCQCLPGWSGEMCSQAEDVCNPNPCYPGVTCNSSSTDVAIGYVCGACPTNLVQDGNQCYDVNECLEPAGLGCSSCRNLLGSYMCHCDAGYMLSENRKTCVDIDECQKSNRCKYDGQFCQNLPGSYECLCRPDYFTASHGCIYAPIKFGGNITFKMFNVTGVQFLEWRESMADKQSENYKMISQNVENLVQKLFTAVDAFVGVKATQLQKGSIRAMFDLYFMPNASVNASYLDGLFGRYLQGQSCEVNGPDCVVSELIGINPNASGVYDKDLCQSSLDNSCDKETTDCQTENGQPHCYCKAGFERIIDYQDACQDVNECNLDICVMNMSKCINTFGSYHCSCLSGFEMNNGSCTDVCSPNPCANNGVCLVRQNDFVCSCVGIWSGLNCTEENPEAIRLRKIAIGIGVGLGILCLILIVVVVVVCIRQYRHGSSYTCASSTSRGNYKGRRSVNVHNWDAQEIEYRSNGNHHMASMDRDSQPGTNTFTGTENPAYLDSTLDRDSAAKKSSNNYF